ncbi:MAG: histidine phosphatase family protein [Balneolaceae bacterium]|nr:MAG: histidine phosphatase family protein [Balneolaceae bacterium]
MKEKKILVMRHAKSSWDHPGLKDFDRPLNKRGLRDAPAMGRYLQELGLSPDCIISSPAQRARTTVELVSLETGYSKEQILWDDALYYKGAEAYMRAIGNAPEEADTLLIAGHYPMVHQTTSLLKGSSFNEHFSTAAIACLSTEAEQWPLVGGSRNRLLWFMNPKKLP